MVILFLVALVLAWPTAGISVVAYVAFAVLRNHLATKVRTHDANIHAARKSAAAGEKRLPSWASDKTERQIFVEVIKQKAMQDGVPEAWLMAHLRDNDTFMKHVHFAGAMEYHGSSFTEQQAAVSEEISKIWKLVPSPMTDMQRSTTKASPQTPSVGRDAPASSHPKSVVSKQLLASLAKAKEEAPEVARLRNSAAQDDNPAQRLINNVKHVTDVIDARYPARRAGPPDTTKAISEDALLASIEMEKIFGEVEKARALCSQICDVERTFSKTAFIAFVDMVEEQLHDVSLRTLQVQSKIIDVVNRTVLLHSNLPEGKGKEASKEFVAEYNTSIKLLGHVRMQIADDIDRVLTPAMSRAVSVKRT